MDRALLALARISCESKSHNIVHREYMMLVRREVAFAHNLPLNVVIAVIGWIYFVAWTISFYPQVLCMHAHMYTHAGTCTHAH